MFYVHVYMHICIHNYAMHIAMHCVFIGCVFNAHMCVYILICICEIMYACLYVPAANIRACANCMYIQIHIYVRIYIYNYMYIYIYISNVYDWVCIQLTARHAPVAQAELALEKAKRAHLRKGGCRTAIVFFRKNQIA